MKWTRGFERRRGRVIENRVQLCVYECVCVRLIMDVYVYACTRVYMSMLIPWIRVLIHLWLRGKGEWGSGRVGRLRVRMCRILQVDMWAHTCTCIHTHARVYVYMHIPRMRVFIHPMSHRGNAMKGSRGYKGDSSRGKGAESTGCIIVLVRICGLYACTYTRVCVCVRVCALLHVLCIQVYVLCTSQRSMHATRVCGHAYVCTMHVTRVCGHAYECTMHNYVWLCMAMHVLCMYYACTMHTYAWLYMAMHDYVCTMHVLCMAMHVLCMTMYDYVWLCMYYAWLCMFYAWLCIHMHDYTCLYTRTHTSTSWYKLWLPAR